MEHACTYQRPSAVAVGVVEYDPAQTDVSEFLRVLGESSLQYESTPTSSSSSSVSTSSPTQDNSSVAMSSVIFRQIDESTSDSVAVENPEWSSPRPVSMHPLPSGVHGDPQEDVMAFLQLLRHSHQESGHLSSVVFNDGHMMN
jgi:hypothetical protein